MVEFYLHVTVSQQNCAQLCLRQAGLGIAELIVAQMMDEGLTLQQARDNIFLLNSKGLITKDRAKNLTARHQQFAKVSESGVQAGVQKLLHLSLMGPPLGGESI